MTPRITETEERTLSGAMRGGDRGAFEGLVRRCLGQTLNVIYHISGDYGSSCLIVRDAFIAAWERREQWPAGQRFSSWVLMLAVDILRERRASPEAAPPRPSTEGQRRGQRKQPLPEWLQECFDTLPHEMREVLVLKDLERFSYAETCSLLQIGPELLIPRLSRSREAFRDCLLKSERNPHGS